MEIAIGIIGLLLAALALVFQQNWFPPKYHMVDRDPEKDPNTLKALFKRKNILRSSRPSTLVVPYMIRKYEDDGYKKVKILFGKECIFGRLCVWTGIISNGTIAECILMAKPIGPNPSVMSSAPSGQPPVYVTALSDLPPGIKNENVRWVMEKRIHEFEPVLNSNHQEWRLKDPKEDMILVWKKQR